MNDIVRRFVTKFRSNSVGMLVFAILSICTITVLHTNARGLSLSLPFNPGPAVPLNTAFSLSQGDVKLTGKMSQTKFVEFGNGNLYLEIAIETPKSYSLAAIAPEVIATDVVVLLDRSGSMAAQNKLPYAKAAIQELISSLTEKDRFALVTFDTAVSTWAELAPVTTRRQEMLRGVVEELHPGGSTDLSAGIQRVQEILRRNPSERSRRLILLSDGQANMGITAPDQLAQMVSSIARDGSVVSTIGLGLDFNETLMASLADHGMGNYSFLEHLANLNQIFAKDLNDARAVFARSSELNIQPNDGVTLIDAAGYPMQPVGRGFRIPTGQLKAGSQKAFTLTFGVPTSAVGPLELGELSLSYVKDGEQISIAIPQEQIALAVVPAVKRAEALASVNAPAVKDAWYRNNFGAFQQQLSNFVRSGDKRQAEELVGKFRSDLNKASADYDIDLAKDEKIIEALEKSKRELDDAFSGAPEEQPLKQNRFSKKAHAEGKGAQVQVSQ